jgi:hypothetical protein
MSTGRHPGGYRYLIFNRRQNIRQPERGDYGKRIRYGIRGRVADADPGPDPYPDWIRIHSGQWIRIRNPDPDPDPGGQKLPTKVEIFCKSSCLSIGWPLLRADLL